MGLVDTADGVATGLDNIGEEVGEDALTGLQAQLTGRDGRDEDLIRRRIGGEGRQATLDEVGSKEGCVVLLGNATQHHTLESLVGLQHPGLGGEALHVGDTREARELIHQQFIDDDGLRLGVVEALVVYDLYVTPETHDLITYLALETEDDAYGEDHHGKAHGDAPNGNGDGRPRDAALVIIAMAKEAAGKGEGK